jgi:hypothetical protein
VFAKAQAGEKERFIAVADSVGTSDVEGGDFESESSFRLLVALVPHLRMSVIPFSALKKRILHQIRFFLSNVPSTINNTQRYLTFCPLRLPADLCATSRHMILSLRPLLVGLLSDSYGQLYFSPHNYGTSESNDRDGVCQWKYLISVDMPVDV